eukprot:356913-Chlamydomonas_euryale.AAC.10
MLYVPHMHACGSDAVRATHARSRRRCKAPQRRPQSFVRPCWTSACRVWENATPQRRSGYGGRVEGGQGRCDPDPDPDPDDGGVYRPGGRDTDGLYDPSRVRGTAPSLSRPPLPPYPPAAPRAAHASAGLCHASLLTRERGERVVAARPGTRL